jgi:hypothetical protein
VFDSAEGADDHAISLIKFLCFGRKSCVCAYALDDLLETDFGLFVTAVFVKAIAHTVRKRVVIGLDLYAFLVFL